MSRSAFRARWSGTSRAGLFRVGAREFKVPVLPMVGLSDPEVLVPLLAIFCIFGLPLIAWMLARHYAHRERMAMIRAGLTPLHGNQWAGPGMPPTRPVVSVIDDESPHRVLRKGIVITAVGAAILIGMSTLGFGHRTVGFDPFGNGIAITTWHPGPWLLFGFIPLFVGIAQIGMALLSGATFTRQVAAPPSPSGAKSTVAPPRGESSYPYRPSGEYEELRPPEGR